MTEIRRAREDDQPALIEILRATYLGTMADIVPPEALEAFHSGNEAGRFVEQCWQDFDVITEGEQVAGLVFVHEGRVESLHIHPDYARKGYGAALLGYAESQISDNSPTAELDVLSGNQNALDFYAARGWEKVREFTGKEAGDVPAQMILMRKSFDPETLTGRSLADLWIRFQGRATRREFWLLTILPAAGLFLIALLARALENSLGGIVQMLAISYALFLVPLWPLFAVIVKRRHDRGKTGRLLFWALFFTLMFWWLQGSFAAILTAMLWLAILVVAGFLPGETKTNRYGSPSRTG